MNEWLGLKEVWDASGVLKLVTRYLLDLGTLTLLLRWVYSRFGGASGISFSCMMLNAVTFAICLLLRKVPVELGFALGLFGVFGILRYRTQPIGTRDLTYLFMAIALGMLNAVANKHISLAELLLINGAIVGLAAALERRPLIAKTEVHEVLYDNLALLQKDRLDDFALDLERRTGLIAVSFRIEAVDLLRDSARLSVTCRPRTLAEEQAARERMAAASSRTVEEI